MDGRRFDQLARSLSVFGTRRGLVRLLATLPVVTGIVALSDAESQAKGRRKRRKKRHKHGKGNGRHRKGQKQKCRAKSLAQTCAGKCGPVKNTCKKTVDCGSCACDPLCRVCFTCQEGPNSPGTCVPDPEQQGQTCGDPGQVCQPDGACACDASSCRNPTPRCIDGLCVGCTTSAECVAAGQGHRCCGGACVTGDCCDPSDCTAPDNATATCTAGSCGFTCTIGFGDCNGDPRDGCETALTTDPLNCGACGNACPLQETCVAGGCQCGGFNGTVAPFTCCPEGGNTSCGAAVTFPVVADTCAVADGACPAGYTLCPGPRCNACCPANATCDPQGFCRQT